MELSNWVEQRGSADVADNVRGALEAIDRNEEFIKMTLAMMMAPEGRLSAVANRVISSSRATRKPLNISWSN